MLVHTPRSREQRGLWEGGFAFPTSSPVVDIIWLFMAALLLGLCLPTLLTLLLIVGIAARLHARWRHLGTQGSLGTGRMEEGLPPTPCLATCLSGSSSLCIFISAAVKVTVAESGLFLLPTFVKTVSQRRDVFTSWWASPPQRSRYQVLGVPFFLELRV